MKGTGLEREANARTLVQNADEEVVRNFLIFLLENDVKLFNRFKNAVGCSISPSDMKKYKNQINAIFYNYEGRYGFVDYYNAGPFISELTDFLDHDVQGLLQNRAFEEAFELTNYIFIKAGNQDMDDSDGGTGMLADSCLGIWQEIIRGCNMDMKRKMVQWYADHLNGTVIDYMEEYIEQILFDEFKEDEFLNFKNKFSGEKFASYKRENDLWTREYRGGHWAMKYIGVMEDQKESEERIEAFCKENLEFSSVREYYVKTLISKEMLDDAIDILKEGKIQERDSSGLVARYSLQLKDLYQQIGDTQAYERELWSFVLEYKHGDIAAYQELKSLYREEEWKEKREVIFEKLSPYTKLDKLYEMEKLYDRLLEIVLASGIHKLMEYEKCLKPLYPAELFSKYETTVQNMATHVSTRKQYQEIVGLLRKMQQYPEGGRKVKDIASDWQMIYKNRRAMMDELRKL